jgi:hypothetical protein
MVRLDRFWQMVSVFLLGLALVIIAEAGYGQTSNQPLQVSITSDVQGTLRGGGQFSATVTLINQLPKRTASIQAFATYTYSNQTATVQSNVVTLEIDDTITLPSLKLRLTNITGVQVTDSAGASVGFTATNDGVELTNLSVSQGTPLVLRVRGTVPLQ